MEGQPMELHWRSFAGVKLFHLLAPFGTHPTLQQSHTTIPAEDGVVVGWRPDLLGLFEVVHCFLEDWQNCVGRTAGPKLRLCFSLANNAEMIDPFILAGETAKHALRF